MKTRLFALVATLLLGLGVNTVRSADLTWTNSVSSDWNSAANWIPQQVPTASDHVIINSGSVTIPADGAFAIMDWTGGDVYGSLTVASNGVLNVGGSAAKTLYGPLTNARTVVCTSTSYLRPLYSPGNGYYGAIYNLAGGLFDIQNDQFVLWYTYGGEVFNNAGTLRKSAGTGTTSIYPQLINTGLVDVESGTLAFVDGGIMDGQFHAAAGTAILFSGSFTSGNAPLLNGAGAFQFTGGTLTLLSDVIPNLQMLSGTLVLGPAFQGGSITNLTLAGMTLSGANVVTGTATLGVGDSGSLTVASNGVLNVGGSAAKTLYGPLTNAGTVVCTSTSYLRPLYSPGNGYYGAIYNLAGGLFDIQNDQFVLWYTYGGEVFNNAGTLRKSAGTGTTSIYPQLINTGLVDVESGTLAFVNSFTPTGGELRFGLSSLTDYGKITFPGSATLNGTVGVVWLGGYVPATNNSFTVLNYGSYSGLFTALDLPAAVLWATNYSATAFTVMVASINKLAFISQPVSGKIPGTILPPVMVQVEYPIGDPVAASGVPITLALNSGSGVLSGTLTQLTDPTGKATFSDLSTDQIGTKALLASAAVLTPATSEPFKIVPLIEGQRTSSGFMLQLNGNNSLGTIVIYASTDLMSWTPIYTNPPTTNIIQYLDTFSTNYPVRFYRAVEQ